MKSTKETIPFRAQKKPWASIFTTKNNHKEFAHLSQNSLKQLLILSPESKLSNEKQIVHRFGKAEVFSAWWVVEEVIKLVEVVKLYL